MQTAQLLSSPTFTAVTGLAAGVVNDDPPLVANMVDISAYLKTAAPLYIEALIKGEDATARDLTGAHWFGKHALLETMVDLGPVNGGYDVSVSTTKFHRDTLVLVAGIYSHVGIGKGTLSASTIALQLYALETVGC
mgnify:CR=1 FL=1